MIDYNELISRFNDIQDLPVSEEMLGAYCEGTLDGMEAAEVRDCISDSADVGELMGDVVSSIVQEEPFSLHPTAAAFGDMDLPDVPTADNYNPFDIGIADAPWSDVGIFAAAVSPSFCGNADDFISDTDDSFSTTDHSINLESNIDSDDSVDDINVEL